MTEAMALFWCFKNYPALLWGGRRTARETRQQVIERPGQATTADFRQEQACAAPGLTPRTVQRWQADAPIPRDQRPFGNTSRLAS